ncbi:MAG: YdjY domain-containing protein [Phycisphaerales bacterium]|nr:YdjY domain-containing protein [Phycisphaerales bacterium]
MISFDLPSPDTLRLSVLFVLASVLLHACQPTPIEPIPEQRPPVDPVQHEHEHEPKSEPKSELTRNAPLKPIELPSGIVVDREAREVVVPAFVSIDVGWLEQVVCVRNTRDHEAILVVDVLPSQVHAALVLLGLDSGTPGYWRFEEMEGEIRPRVSRMQPEGDQVRVTVRRVSGDRTSDEPISSWIVNAEDAGDFTEQPWVFGGSTFVRFTPDGPERYSADQSGSLVGLVTFGDEVLGLRGVRSDQVDVDAALWGVRTNVVPGPGTRVELILAPWAEDD